jgi:hypothetical protein
LKPQKRLIRTELLGADFDNDGLSIELDWRYEMVMDYLRLSHSYSAVLLTMKGKKSPYPLPSDYAIVEAVVKDFQDISRIGERQWWDTIGKGLFGIRAPTTNVELASRIDAVNQSATCKWQGSDSLVLTIPVTMKPAQALRQLKELFAAQQLPNPAPPAIAPKYQISNNRMHQQTMNLGVAALRRYKQGKKLREIGDRLEEYAESRYDDSAIRRLISLAALIAENAARGRFFSNKAFPEALTDTYRRKAGRPVGTKGIKWKRSLHSVKNNDA